MKSRGILYLLPTPLGSDLGPNELSFQSPPFSELRHFIVEDVRTARRFLRKAGYKADFDAVTFFEMGKHSDIQQFDSYLNVAKNGTNLGLLSEAGMPCIADPGASLVAAAHRMGIKVIPISGPSSLFLALAASGLNGQWFEFHGYLPIAERELKTKIKKLSSEIQLFEKSHLFIETPYRSDRTFQYLLKELQGETRLCLAINITQADEAIKTLTVSQWRARPMIIGKRPTVFVIGK